MITTPAGVVIVSRERWDSQLRALGVLLLGLAMIAVAVLRHTQRVADYVANGTAAFTVIWLYECIGVWWDRRTMQRLMRLDQRAELRLVEREERTG